MFVPDSFRLAVKDKKQGSGGEHPSSEYWREAYEAWGNIAIDNYCAMVNAGVCPEQARYILPQGVMVNWVWTGSLLAYARFYKLRSKTDTQEETRRIAKEVGVIANRLFPVSWKALVNYKEEDRED